MKKYIDGLCPPRALWCQPCQFINPRHFSEVGEGRDISPQLPAGRVSHGLSFILCVCEDSHWTICLAGSKTKRPVCHLGTNDFPGILIVVCRCGASLIGSRIGRPHCLLTCTFDYAVRVVIRVMS